MIPEPWVPEWASIAEQIARWRSELFTALMLLGWGAVERMGVVVRDGERGVKFSFGRAVGVVEPGFHPLIPMLQTVRAVPARARTLDLEAQRCATQDGHVFHVDANVVWQIHDVRRALLEVDDVQRGPRDALAVSVQQVIRSRVAAEVSVARGGGAGIDEVLRSALTARVDGWGVRVISAGFVTAVPSAQTLRITQLREVVAARLLSLRALERAGLPSATALTVLGTRARLRSRAAARRRRMTYYERARRLWVTRGRDLDLPGDVLNAWERTGRR